jgi:methanogenic corrinoid protein MtbC1
VAAEHAASHAMLRRLAAAYQAAGRPAPRAGSILVGMPPTVRHELGALAFSTAARRAGLPILYLGSDVPVDDWVATAQRTGARAAVVGAVTAADVRPAIEVGAALRAALPRLVLAFGGHASAGAAEGLQTRGRLEDSNYAAAGDALLVLPDRLGEAVDALDHALRRASPG